MSLTAGRFNRAPDANKSSFVCGVGWTRINKPAQTHQRLGRMPGGGDQTFYLYVMILWYTVYLFTEMTLLSPIHLYKYSTNVCVEGKPC